jgi:hypothetical protein
VYAQTSVYTVKPNETQQAELEAWGTMYLARLSTGVPAAGAETFAFSTASMNTPLFSAHRAAQLTAASVTGASTCEASGTIPTDDVAQLLTSGSVSASITEEPDEALSILEAVSADPEAELSLEGEELVASNLTPAQVTGTPAASVWADVCEDTLAWIAVLETALASWASALDPSDDARRQLLGTPRTVDQLQTLVSDWAVVQGVDITPYQVEARFGAFGSLPIIVAVFTDSPDSGFLLIDGVTGALDGPFAPGTAINPLALLAGHPGAYESWMAVALIETETGCEIVVAKSWRPTPPPGYTPRPPCALCPSAPWIPPGTPIFPVGPFPVTSDPTLPGWQQTPTCATNPTGCVCSTYGWATSPAPGTKLVPYRVKCTAAGPCPVPPPASLPSPGMTSTTEYYY